MVSFHAIDAKQPSLISKETAKKHILKLTQTGGRLTGSESEAKAAEYIINELKSYGLTPWNSDSYKHAFEFNAGTNLGENNKLIVNDEELKVDKDFRPLVFSGLGDFAKAPVVFAGYGITEPEAENVANNINENYDSYVHLDVKDKWVLVMRFMPEDISAEQRIKINRFSSERHKVLNARTRGAKGVIFVHGPNTIVKNTLIPLTFDASSGNGSMPVVSVSTSIANKWFKNSGKDWVDIQKKLDVGKFVMGFEFDDLAISANIDLVQDKQTANNVIAYIKGSTDLPAVILGAHYDHLGHGESSTSLAREEEYGFVHPGADDNASGVSGVLSIAHYLADQKNKGQFKPIRDVIFAFWSGEELGLLGSNNFVKSSGKDNVSEEFMANINLDMIGRLKKQLMLQGAGSSNKWDEIIELHNASIKLNIKVQEDAYLPTDAMSFYLYKVPVLSAFTGSHAEYHSPRDTANLVNYKGVAKISKLLALITRGLAMDNQPLDFQQQKPKKNNNMRGGIRAYIGTIPDYANDITGVLLSGTTKGSPADKAGIKAGDILIELAGTKIENLYDFTYVLDALKIGKTVTAKVLRDGKEVELKVTPGSRQ
jgi:hypothetical protein